MDVSRRDFVKWTAGARSTPLDARIVVTHRTRFWPAWDLDGLLNRT